MRTELLRDGHQWLRIADSGWSDPLDPTYAQQVGGRWNPPGSFPTLYLNEDLPTARTNLMSFIAQWPYESEDLRNDTGPVLVTATLPRRQHVADIDSNAGIAAARLPATYPLDAAGALVPHEACQPIGAKANAANLRGVRCRSAHFADGAGRELAWFPATSRSHAHHVATVSFEDWFWA